MYGDEERMESIEQSFLAKLLAYPEEIADLPSTLFPSHFLTPFLSDVWDAMRGLWARGVGICPTSVCKELADRGQLTSRDDENFIHKLWGTSGTSADILWCADVIRTDWQRREAAKECNRAAQALKASDANLPAVLDCLGAKLDDITKCSLPGGPRPMVDDLERVYSEARSVAETGAHNRGVLTGFARLDRCTSGLQPGTLTVLAAQTAMGKTSLAMNIAVNAAKADAGVVVFFSMEMGRCELAGRVASSETGLDLRRVADGKLSREEWRSYSAAQPHLELVGGKLLLDVSGRITPAVIRGHLRRIQRKQPIALVVVDYLQLCGASERAESQYVKTSMISGDLKAIAVDFDVPVLALSQLSREAARRGGEPRLSDLRDSGTIEQDANTVIFIHRSDRASGDLAQSEATIIVAKNRSGPTGKFTAVWNANCVRFSEPACDRVCPRD